MFTHFKTLAAALEFLISAIELQQFEKPAHILFIS